MPLWYTQRSALNTIEGYHYGSHVTFNDIREDMDTGFLPSGCLRTKHGYSYDIYSDAERLDDLQEYSFRVRTLRHVTDLDSFMGICEEGGFRGGHKFVYQVKPKPQRYSWWSVHRPDVVVDRFIERADRAEGIRGTYEASPPFSNAAEVYGNYSFEYCFNHLLDEYEEQFCRGGHLVLRIMGTFVYNAEVQYAVLVHSSRHDNMFDHLPQLNSTTRGQKVFMKNNIVYWSPESVLRTVRGRYAAWETMSFAFHLPGDTVLEMPDIQDHFSVVPCKRFQGKGEISVASAIGQATKRTRSRYLTARLLRQLE